ncbi:MAG: D-aminoacyl-tRNA deacylase [Actinomycetota bacterium]|nr:D-aminoacyl-tRNA deacylase [Actinomycetota bacterium]
MRAVVQRVSRARVLVDGSVVGAIGKGLAVLLGVSVDDSDDGSAWMVEKIANLRVFSDDEGKMNRSLLDVGGEALLVSQFTLLGDARKGRRPSFVKAASGTEAERLYEAVATGLRQLGVITQTGEFGASMQVELTNEGPITLLLDSEKSF